MSHPSAVEILAATLFALAILHTFLASRFQRAAARFPEGSALENLLHLLGEVEVVFGLWAAILLLGMMFLVGPQAAIGHAEGLDFGEPLFVFAIMTVAATRPVIAFAQSLMSRVGRYVQRALPISPAVAEYAACLTVGPLLGSFITEPAAMTVTALVLCAVYFNRPTSSRFRYVTIATLFVNVSIGGVLTPYAAPPVLMVAGKWGWGLSHMASVFGWKAAIAVTLNSALAAFIARSDLTALASFKKPPDARAAPGWLVVIHLAFLASVVIAAHHPVIFIGLLLFFMGVVTITREFQDDLKLRQSLLVAFFLGGLVVLGGLQRWWLEPLIRGLGELPLYLGATALTAITDNAALTFLGSQVEGVSEGFKYHLVAGAVAGGGLTVIANAPNPAGFSILQEHFGEEGIDPLRLLVSALAPTLVALVCFGLL